MSSIGVVFYRKSPMKTQVLQESVNNSLNISNNDGVRREVIILGEKKVPLQNTVSVTSLVRAAEVPTTLPAKRARIRENSADESRSPTPLAVARRNARERNRVRQVNDGFAALRRHIPDEVAAAFENANSNRGSNKKLSKVETLRMAVEYIRNLETLLNIGHADKENPSHMSMESFPSPASSSPRENSQERSYVSVNSPIMEDDDLEDEDIDGSLQLPHQSYLEMVPENFHLVSTPHLYDEEDNSQPLTPTSDLIAQEEVNAHLLDNQFHFSTSAEQFAVISDQNYDADIPVNESEFEVKYAESLHFDTEFNETGQVSYEVISPDLVLNNHYKFKEDEQFINEVDLKKELPDIQVTPEDRQQFEETLKWWQEKTRQARKNKSN